MVHATLTNLLIHHKFLAKNDEYQLLQRRIAGTISASAVPGASAGPSKSPPSTLADAMDDEDGPIIEEDSADGLEGSKQTSLVDVTFPELSHDSALNVSVLRERLLILLDHPSLENHLLRTNNLLYILVSLTLRC